MTAKATGIVVVVLVLLGIGGWYLTHKNSGSTEVNSADNATYEALKQPSQSTSASVVTKVSAPNTTDEALDADVKSIDDQMMSLEADTSTADQALANPNK